MLIYTFISIKIPDDKVVSIAEINKELALQREMDKIVEKSKIPV
jgi:hypothetical protein